VGDSKIEWTDKVWNVVRGCSPASEGCRNCFAVRQAIRFADAGELEDPGVWLRKPGPFHGFVKSTPQGPRWTGRVELIPEKLDEPLRWRKPQRVFVNSMSDLFHEALSDEAIAAVFGVMASARQHTFQILTKRPARMREWFAKAQGWPAIGPNEPAGVCRAIAEQRIGIGRGLAVPIGGDRWPLPNVWLGVSPHDQESADRMIPELLQAPAAVRFVSYEPALGPADFTRLLRCPRDYNRDGDCDRHPRHVGGCPRIDWVIVGGESGPRRRPFELAWLESVAAQCDAAGVPLFVKQDSGLRSGTQGRIPDALWARKEFPR
jgi:protein gp37